MLYSTANDTKANHCWDEKKSNNNWLGYVVIMFLKYWAFFLFPSPSSESSKKRWSSIFSSVLRRIHAHNANTDVSCCVNILCHRRVFENGISSFLQWGCVFFSLVYFYHSIFFRFESIFSCFFSNSSFFILYFFLLLVATSLSELNRGKNEICARATLYRPNLHNTIDGGDTKAPTAHHIWLIQQLTALSLMKAKDEQRNRKKEIESESKREKSRI